MENCNHVLAELRQSLSQLSPDLSHTHEKLVSILRTLSGLNFKPKFPTQEVLDFQKQLRDIEANLSWHPTVLKPSELSAEEQYVDKLRHLSYDAANTMPGKEIVVDLLARCLLWTEIMLHRCVRFIPVT